MGPGSGELVELVATSSHLLTGEPVQCQVAPAATSTRLLNLTVPTQGASVLKLNRYPNYRYRLISLMVFKESVSIDLFLALQVRVTIHYFFSFSCMGMRLLNCSIARDRGGGGRGVYL